MTQIDFHTITDIGGLDFDSFSFTVPAPEVTSVTFENLDSPIDGNPNVGGGRRLFTDRATPTGPIKNRVRVKAATTYQANTRIYFKSFDVDDPETDALIDDNGGAGNDNRQGRGTPQSAGSLFNAVSALTDSSGVASVIFETTRQPGDNFVVAASAELSYLDSIAVNGTGLRDSSGTALPTVRAKRSEMLTVWRTLYLEVDSMGKYPPDCVLAYPQCLTTTPRGNHQSGTIDSSTFDGATNRTTLHVRQPLRFPAEPCSTLDVNRHENGRIRLTSDLRNGPFYFFNVVSNTCDTISINGTLGIAPVGMSFTIWDDDDYNRDDGSNLDGDYKEDIEALPETFALMVKSDFHVENVFGPAYIRPDYDWARNTGYNQSNIAFNLNVEDSFVAIEQQLNLGMNSGGDGNNDFWVVCLQLGYQHTASEDNDPNDELGTTGISAVSGDLVNSVTNSGEIPTGGIGSLIYLEVQRDIEVFDGQVRLRRTAPHEIGHLFGISGHAGSDADTIGDLGVMGSGDGIRFIKHHLNILRWRVTSPGH